MAILVTLLLVVGACYSPDLPPRTDGSIDDAAAIADAAELGDDAAIDAPDQQHGLLVVKIEDRGTVTVAGAGSCTDTAPGHTYVLGPARRSRAAPRNARPGPSLRGLDAELHRKPSRLQRHAAGADDPGHRAVSQRELASRLHTGVGGSPADRAPAARRQSVTRGTTAALASRA